MRSDATPFDLPQFSWRQSDAEQTGWRWNQLAAAPTKKRVAAIRGGVRSTKAARLEAVLLVADGPLTAGRIAQFATLADGKEVRQLIKELNQAFDDAGCAFRIERVGTGFQLLTRREYAPWLDRMHQRHASLKLSPAAMETLTIVAYRQPITRADVEAIRGVQSSEMLKQLMERGLVRIGGEDDSLGRPFLYVTTRQFLEVFGIHKLDDLPMSDTLRRKKAKPVVEPELGEGLLAEGIVVPSDADGSSDDALDESEDNDDDLDADDEDDAYEDEDAVEEDEADEDADEDDDDDDELDEDDYDEDELDDDDEEEDDLEEAAACPAD